MTRPTRRTKSIPRKCIRTGKVKFNSELDARIALAGRINRDLGEKRVYQCEFCHEYHLTSQNKGRASGD